MLPEPIFDRAGAAGRSTEHPAGAHATQPQVIGARQAPQGVDPIRLRAVLEHGLRDHLIPPARVHSVQAVPMDTFSSHPISRLRVTLDGGEELAMVFKRLRPGPEKDVRRELLTYQRLLAGRRFGAPELYASVCDEARGHYWLLLEDVGEWRLDWCDIDGWVGAAQWLAGLHAAYHGRTEELRALDCLGDHGPVFYWTLAETARESLDRLGEPRARARFDALMNDRFDGSVAHLNRQQRTLVHGDVSGHNLMVQARYIRPIDWEWAAVGLAAWDVAKLLAGWGNAKPRLVAAYLEAFGRHAAVVVDQRAFERTLAHCEILRVLWYMRWWIEPCREPAFVDRLLDKMERTWDHLGAGSSGGSADD